MKERKKFEIIRKISEIIYKLNPQKNVFLTIIDVKLPQKGGRMKVYLSIYPEKKTKRVIDYLNKRQNKIKEEIKRNIYLRYLPSEVIFYPSFEFKEAEKVLKLIDENSKEEKRAEN
jgi:ribosome-binding factor A